MMVHVVSASPWVYLQVAVVVAAVVAEANQDPADHIVQIAIMIVTAKS